MNVTRSLASRALGLAAALSLVAGVLAATVTPAQAATRWASVQGYVQNQLGHYQDDVVVELLNPDGTIEASQLTYEGEGQDHGFYNLTFKFDTALTHEFKLRFSSLPDVAKADRFKTQTLKETVVVDRRNDFVFIDDVMMQLAEKVDTTTTLDGVKETVQDNETHKVTITVATPRLKKLEGKVEVVISRKGGAKAAEALDKKFTLAAVKKKVGTSEVEFTVPKLESPGAPKCKVWKDKKKTKCKEYKSADSYTWDVDVTFLGSELAKKSDATAKIVSWAKGHQPVTRALPNAVL